MWEGFLEEGICERRPEEAGVGKHVGSGVSSGRVDNQPLLGSLWTSQGKQEPVPKDGSCSPDSDSEVTTNEGVVSISPVYCGPT